MPAALDDDSVARAAFDALAPTHRKELGRSVAEAKRPKRANVAWSMCSLASSYPEPQATSEGSLRSAAGATRGSGRSSAGIVSR